VSRSWPALVAWGGGWAAASILLPLSARAVGPSSTAAVFAAAFVVGTALVGWPIYTTARGTIARYPVVEATLWVLLLAAMATMFVRATMSFEPVNAVTTEDIRRGQHGGTWPYPPELIWGLRAAGAYCVLVAVSTSLLTGAHGLLGRLWRAALLSVGIAVSLGAAVLIFVLAGPLVWRLFPLYRVGAPDVWRVVPLEIVGVAAAAFLAGCVAGAGIIPLRRLLA
jgi:hypothetical protein